MSCTLATVRATTSRKLSGLELPDSGTGPREDFAAPVLGANVPANAPDLFAGVQ